jgi:translocation and assembly module TamB
VDGAYLPATNDSVSLHVVGIEGTDLEAALRGGIRPEDLNLHFEARDLTVIPARLGIREPVSLTLSLVGPRTAATLELEIERGGEPVLAMNGTTAYGEPLGFSGSSLVTVPADQVSTAVLEMIGRTIQLTIDAELDQGTARLRTASAAFEGGKIEVSGSYELDTGTLDFTPILRYDDVHRLAGEPGENEVVALAARLPMRGTLADLHVVPDITLNDEPWIVGEIDLALGESKDVKATLRAFPAGGLVPEAYRELLASGAGIDLDARLAEGRATFRAAHVAVGSATLDAQGTYDTEGGVLDLTADLAVAELHDFEGIAKQPLSGALTLNVIAKGDAVQTTAEGALAIENMTAGTVTAPSGTMAVKVVGGAFPNDITESLEVAVEGDFPDLALKPELARDLVVKGAATIENLHRIAVRGFELSDGNLVAKADGTVDVEARTADFIAMVEVAQIGDYAALMGQSWQGEATVRAEVTSGDTPGVIGATLEGKLGKLDGLPDAWRGLAGNAAVFSGHGNYDGERISVAAFTWASKGIQADAVGHYMLAERTLEAELNGNLSDLSALSSLAKRELAGATQFDLTASGVIDDIAVQGDLHGGPLEIDAFRADSAEIRFNATGIPSTVDMEGAASLARAGELLALNVQLVKRGSQITVGEFNASTGESGVSGSGELDLNRKRGHGTLKASLPDLSALQTWIDVPLEGRLDLEATLEENSGRLTGTTSGAGLVVPGASIESLDGRFDIADPFSAPGGTAMMEATAVRTGDWALDTLSVTTDGPADAWRIALQTAGEFKEATRFTVDSKGVLSRSAGSLSLEALQLKAEEHVFALRAPTSVTWREGVLTVASFAITGDTGSMEVGGSYGSKAINLRADLLDLPLRLVELAGVDPPAGTISGMATLRGTPVAPVLEAEVKVAGYNPDPDGENNFPGFDAQLRANFSDGALRISGAGKVPDTLLIEASASLNAAWSLAPWHLELSREQPLHGTLKGTGDLAAIPPLFAMEGHDIRGDLDADLTLAGTPASPGLDGAVTLKEGYYENGSSSTIVNDIEATLNAEGSTLRLTEFTANDGQDGAITGEGQIAFATGSGMPFFLALKLNGPRLVHRDDMQAEGSGEVRLEGDATGATITGDLSIGPAEVRLPERTAKAPIATVPFTVAGEAPREEKVDTRGPYAITLDVDATLPGRVYFRGPGLDSEWEGNLSADGDVRNPVVRGILQVKRGRLDFLGREFDLAESTITFDGETPPAPYLNILAVTEADDIVARVRIQGVQNALEITMESEPPLPRDEILARVLFGQRLSEVSPVQALTLARYAPIFSKNATAQTVLGSSAPASSLVDRFTVRGGTGVGEASITTGKYLTDDFYLEFEQGLGSAESLVSLEWIFAPEWSLKARTTSQGDGGVGVFWKKSY